MREEHRLESPLIRSPNISQGAAEMQFQEVGGCASQRWLDPVIKGFILAITEQLVEGDRNEPRRAIGPRVLQLEPGGLWARLFRWRERRMRLYELDDELINPTLKR